MASSVSFTTVYFGQVSALCTVSLGRKIVQVLGHDPLSLTAKDTLKVAHKLVESIIKHEQLSIDSNNRRAFLGTNPH